MKNPIWFLGKDVYDKLNPPIEPVLIKKDGVYLKFIDSEEWLHVGYIPTPKTRIDWFFYNLIHGIWMKYPLWSVILFSLLNKENGVYFCIEPEEINDSHIPR